jgi:hypothetical protein
MLAFRSIPTAALLRINVGLSSIRVDVIGLATARRRFTGAFCAGTECSDVALCQPEIDP